RPRKAHLGHQDHQRTLRERRRREHEEEQRRRRRRMEERGRGKLTVTRDKLSLRDSSMTMFRLRAASRISLNSNGPLAGALSVQPHRPGFHHASWASDAVAAGAPRRLCAAGLPGNCARQPSGGGVMAARRALGSGPPRNGSLHRPRLAARSCVSWGRARSLWPRSPRATGGPRSGSARGGKPSARKICAPRGNAHEPFAC
ncbi:unnamed protein product, partial [Prorocentrum cordatum]